MKDKTEKLKEGLACIICDDACCDKRPTTENGAPVTAVCEWQLGIADNALKACKESGLMFTQTTRSPQDVPLPESMIRAGVKSWEFKEIIEDIDV